MSPPDFRQILKDDIERSPIQLLEQALEYLNDNASTDYVMRLIELAHWKLTH